MYLKFHFKRPSWVVAARQYWVQYNILIIRIDFCMRGLALQKSLCSNLQDVSRPRINIFMKTFLALRLKLCPPAVGFYDLCCIVRLMGNLHFIATFLAFYSTFSDIDNSMKLSITKNILQYLNKKSLLLSQTLSIRFN